MNVSLVDDGPSLDDTLSSDTPNKLINNKDKHRPKSSESLESGDRHGRLLLAALLENFCRLYEADSNKAERLFSVLCKTLSAMGILDQENVDELAGVRSHYSRAFKNLMLQAREAVDLEDEQPSSKSRRSITFEDSRSISDESEEEESTSDSDHLSKKNDIFRIASSGARLSLSEWLGFEESKYKSEFQELGLLGKGGFGAVYHVRHKIDDREYAVKKISMRRASTNQAKVYREIKTLARLEHPNIIRYFSSWLEHSKPATEKRLRGSAISSSHNEDMLFLMDHEEPSFSSNNLVDSDSYEDSGGVVFEASDHDGHDGHQFEKDEDDEDGEDDSVAAMPVGKLGRPGVGRYARHQSQSSDGTSSSQKTLSPGGLTYDHEASSLPSSRTHQYSLSTSIEEIPRPSHSMFSMSLPHHHTKFNRPRRKSESAMCLTLFIQMHLCPTTLRDHIRQRNAAYCRPRSGLKDKLCSRTYIDLFRAILEGAKYVHKFGLCHRDIKPSNIFLAQVDDSERGAVQVVDAGSGNYLNIVPKLGDFGLVLPTSSDDDEDEDEDGVGTAIYGAPEQFSRSGTNTHQMTSKCDVYALGIVFFEMLQYTSITAMERAKLLTDLRHGILPDEFVQQHPAEAAVILAMTCHDPNKRPSVDQILEMEIVVSTEDRERDKELRRVKDENEALRKRIQELEQAKA
ncbi:Eukaryotic translation initiation factor 2-alpha kinase 2 [Taphrina deformans PYCC 5710]|uniref:non-specific serine/threonine protein kinase n=1 Tax=Taphrina deformans (strain PYCC 5710 / ATCC 11124 / CBS 356.35 / IMI 108563 / JCM 9778 / NBRC 8474) TaxID=1097556 RepID=R4X937_TAPDE|nr:Eukaryotic translation initiation factor 2-alpha kinase 2 [Taphrina deformans PYCC 5710]|eukprot:CCG82168.1 Eukaryotic translation initiation factor 2-alpha kinase 2 [Taphrina deformans PYCC 5710]